MSKAVEIPAMPNAHSHAFQIDMREITERPPASEGKDDFWSWRESMYRLAGSLTPESMKEVASRAYAEMNAAGYGAVGEFHYVHHQPDGTPYEEPNTMAIAVAEAAIEQDLPIVLLPAAYHRGGWDIEERPPTEGQRRFCDPDVETFLARVDGLRAWAADREGVGVGVAAHSIRAVPASWLERIAAYADEHVLVRHIHASEQPREVAESQAEHNCSPIELLNRTGFLGERTSVIHGIHVSDRDIELIAKSNTIIVTCPTTEGYLGDGYFPALRYRDAGVRMAIGSDSNARINPSEELRELETGARREGQTRHGLLAHYGDLWDELCLVGSVSLGLSATETRGLLRIT